MKSIHIRIDEALKRRFNLALAADGKTAQEVLSEAINEYCDRITVVVEINQSLTAQGEPPLGQIHRRKA